MRITLQIENVDRLETGGQLSYSCADRGFDIGRHEHLDWSLPDPQRVISGKHCEVRFEDGQFILYDCSTNGTFLNGSQTRMDKAHVLRSGDRLMIGDYIIVVSLEAPSAFQSASAAPAASAASHPWDTPQNSPVSAGSAWPTGPGPSAGPASPYPMDNQGGPWASPVTGMEGRHAPPSSNPGVGTPADDVWSRQGHGWGTADPSLYDPNAHVSQREEARPAQADPLDHLAQQPFLQPSGSAGANPVFGAPAAEAQSPFPALSENPSQETGEPLFQMPDLQEDSLPQEVVADTGPSPASEPAASPFPEAPVWTTPVSDATQPEPAPEPLPEPPAPVKQAAQEEPVVVSPQEPEQAAVAPAATADATLPGALAGNVDFIKAFAEGAGIPAAMLEGRDPEEFAREIGAILQGITGDLMSLLQARSQVKAMTRNTNRTLIMRSGNNALKFSPTPQMALQTMLAPGAEENGYLPISKAMQAAFKDIQKHHVWTYAAMQKAAGRFEEKLSPRAIEAEGQVAKSTFGNQKAKLWERIQERWSSLSGSYDDGVVGLFTQYFTEGYEELSRDDPEQSSGLMN
ncbi:type VI secretion system-associated FHA domain protein TagH [Roseibium sp. FZY0029]|uniref:type VI secretion system-associated FHA domain protein TagH n=1 Tax=Roseibium sp. FZY0029 TaxID=3116647 RepID=UPI002EC432FC|nr:type VI secretion system-associated FHA domain protein TagH [Roseibium sp. FZY0029]